MVKILFAVFRPCQRLRAKLGNRLCGFDGVNLRNTRFLAERFGEEFVHRLENIRHCVEKERKVHAGGLEHGKSGNRLHRILGIDDSCLAFCRDDISLAEAERNLVFFRAAVGFGGTVRVCRGFDQNIDFLAVGLESYAVSRRIKVFYC